MKNLWKEIMRTPGTTKVQLSLLTILATSSVLSTGLQISSRVGNTSEGSTSSNVESLEVGSGVFRLRVTGKNTTAVLQSLSKTLKSMDETLSVGKSYLYTEPKAK